MKTAEEIIDEIISDVLVFDNNDKCYISANTIKMMMGSAVDKYASQSVHPTPVTDKPFTEGGLLSSCLSKAMGDLFDTYTGKEIQCMYEAMKEYAKRRYPITSKLEIQDKPFTEEILSKLFENSFDGSGVSYSKMTELLNEKAIEWAANKDKEFLIKLRDIIVRYRKQTGETGVGNHIQNEINEYLATK